MTQLKIDNYTKGLLTIIAICLLALTANQFSLIPTVNADPAPLMANPSYGLVPLNEDGTVPVKFSPSEQLDINITGISSSAQLSINIDEVGGYNLYDAIPVEIED